MYQIGDLIIYGNMGVCEITGITVPDLHGVNQEQLYYVLKPLYQECVIYTPVTNTKVFMRPIISAAEAERLIDMIPSVQAEAYYNTSLQQLAEYYEASIGTHDCADLIELTMSIYAKKQYIEQQKRKLGQVDEKFMKRAEELLFGELSAALGISRDKVQKYITSRVNVIKEEQSKNHLK